MRYVTQNQFREMLNNLDRGTPACIFTSTEPRMRKKNNPYYNNCIRLARRNVFLGVDYESCARNAQIRQGDDPDFESGPLPWGEHSGRYFIFHKGQYYLRFYPKPGTLDEQWQTLDGDKIEKSEIAEFLYDSSGGKSPIQWRTVKLENLIQINVAGEQYRIRQETEETVLADPEKTLVSV